MLLLLLPDSDKLSQQGTGLVNGYDFSFQGVLAIMKGFLPVDQQQQQQQQLVDLGTPSPSQRRSAQTTTPVDQFGGEFFNNRKSPKQKPANSHPSPSYTKQLSQYLKALRTFNHSHQVENFTISSEFSDQRQTALFLCGPDYNSGKIEEVLSKYERMGMYGKACAIALFSGNTQRAIASLQRSDDLQLRTLAPPLATHLNTQRHGQARDPIFDQVCRQLSDERTSEPYLRAIFAYCATGDWHEVIDETGLPLKDRLAVGLRFLSDEEIFQWLEDSSRDAVLSGDLEGILLTGLSQADLLGSKRTEEPAGAEPAKKARAGQPQPDEPGLLGPGFRLIQTYVNRTGDLQTAALASHLVVPPTSSTGRHSQTVAERWVDSYRRLLDRWALFTVRVELDISRGLKARQTLSSAHSNTTANARMGPQTGRDHRAPPQLLLRCQHCLEVLSDAPNVLAQLRAIADRNPPVASVALPLSSSVACPSPVGFSTTNSTASAPPTTTTTMTANGSANPLLASSSSKKNIAGAGPPGAHNKQTNRCRMCGKGLPKCSVCMIPLTINDARTASIWAWCHRCRHVGHADHLASWARRGNTLCPVAGCDCVCWDSSCK